MYDGLQRRLMEHCIAWRYPDNMAGSNLMRYTTLMGGMSTKKVQSNACWEIWSCHGGCYYRPKKSICMLHRGCCIRFNAFLTHLGSRIDCLIKKQAPITCFLMHDSPRSPESSPGKGGSKLQLLEDDLSSLLPHQQCRRVSVSSHHFWHDRQI